MPGTRKTRRVFHGRTSKINMKNAPHTEEGKVSLTATADDAEIVAEPGAGEPICPHKDLNMPRSYDEVVERMKRLQTSRDGSAMN